MRNCPLQHEDSASLLLDHSAGHLDADQSRALNRHAETCGRCRAFLDQQDRLWRVLDAWETEPVSFDFQRRFWLRAEQASAIRWWSGISWKPAIPLAALALCLAIGLPRRPTPIPPPPVDMAAAEAAEQAIEDLDMLSQLQSQMK